MIYYTFEYNKPKVNIIMFTLPTCVALLILKADCLQGSDHFATYRYMQCYLLCYITIKLMFMIMLDASREFSNSLLAALLNVCIHIY